MAAWGRIKDLYNLYSLQLWNTVNEGSIGVYRGHSGWVHCVALSQDASKLVSSSDDETVKVKHYEAQKCSIFKGLCEFLINLNFDSSLNCRSGKLTTPMFKSVWNSEWCLMWCLEGIPWLLPLQTHPTGWW